MAHECACSNASVLGNTDHTRECQIGFGLHKEQLSVEAQCATLEATQKTVLQYLALAVTVVIWGIEWWVSGRVWECEAVTRHPTYIFKVRVYPLVLHPCIAPVPLHPCPCIAPLHCTLTSLHPTYAFKDVFFMLGIISPINFMENRKGSLVVACMFGALAALIFREVLAPTGETFIDATVYLALLYPMFICRACHHPVCLPPPPPPGKV